MHLDTPPSSRSFLTANAAPADNHYSGVAMCLSCRMSKSLIYSTCIGDWILYARFKCKPVNISVVVVYIPTKSRKSSSPADVYNLTLTLRELLDKIPRRDNIICMGDFNRRLAGKWCIHKKVDSGGEILLQIMREFGLIAVYMMFQPKACHNNATYLNVELHKAPSRIKYILMSGRWSSRVSNCLVKCTSPQIDGVISMIMECWSWNGKPDWDVTRECLRWTRTYCWQM